MKALMASATLLAAALLNDVTVSTAANLKCELGCGSYCRVAQPDTSCRACYDRCNSSSNSSRPGHSFGAIAATSTTGDIYGYFVWEVIAGCRGTGSDVQLRGAGRTKGACQIAVWIYDQCAALAMGSMASGEAIGVDGTRRIGEGPQPLSRGGRGRPMPRRSEFLLTMRLRHRRRD